MRGTTEERAARCITIVQDDPLCGGGDGSWFVNGAPKNGEVACQSGACPGAALHSCGRGGNGCADDAAQGARMPGGAALVFGLDPGAPQPTAPGATDRRPGANTISSSSAASAEEPSTPFGLGERRLGDVEPEPVGSPAGRAMGAMGAGRPIGPGSAIDGLRPGGAGASCGGEASGFCAALLGGAIGATEEGPTGRENAGSNGGPAPNVLGTADGARGVGGGGIWPIVGPGVKPPNGPGGTKGTRGDIVGGGERRPGGEYSGVRGDDKCGGSCGVIG